MKIKVIDIKTGEEVDFCDVFGDEVMGITLDGKNFIEREYNGDYLDYEIDHTKYEIRIEE